MTVTVYSTPGCSQCKLTAKVLAREQVAYRMVDISEDPTAHAYVTQTLGYSQAPVVVTETGENWSGFRPDLIKALSAGGPNTPGTPALAVA
ncbi:glutaredoxin domain-containing protein [Pseudoclavibacter soli]|uniref:glutaredoxin domain-containing protein n=1 Tax=Pseudoclavibacter soli TaxID=452623 RepID=UPI00041B6576|nr:glutaredoxin domain-containing protein [Pseudoclavibacter soli]